MIKDEQEYINQEITNSTKLLGLIDVMKAYTEALYMNRLNHIDYCKNKALSEADPNNFDTKKFNQTIKNKQNKIKNSLAKADKYYKLMENDFNVNTFINPTLQDALIDKFDEFYNNCIEVKGNELIIKDI